MGRRCLTLSIISGATASWVIDRDCLLQAVQSTTPNVLVTEDPSLTVANIITGVASASATWNVYAVAVQSTTQGVSRPGIELKIPLSAGKTLLVSTTGGNGSVLLYLDDIVS